MSFIDYSRAVIKDSERKTLHTLYSAEIILTIATFILFMILTALAPMLMVSIIAFVLDKANSGRPASDKPFPNFNLMWKEPIIIMYILEIIFSIGIIISLIVALIFFFKTRSICKRTEEEGDFPEIIEYRKKFWAYYIRNLKVILISIGVLVLFIIITKILIGLTDKIDNNSFYKIINMMPLLGLLAFIGINVGYHSFKKVSGKTLLDIAGEEALVIDKKLGLDGSGNSENIN